MSNLVDSYLLFRLKTKRDPEAFAQIYDRYVNAIYRFAFLKLPGEEEAQDITAETFTRAWQFINEKKDVTHIRALLYRIARNLIADFYRANGSQPTVSLDDLKEQEGVVTFEAAGTSTPTEGRQLIEARADLALVLKQLDALKDDYRDVLTLRLIDDLPFNVIGEILEKSTGSVRVIFHRGMKMLRESTGS